LLSEAKRRFLEALTGTDKSLASSDEAEVRKGLYRHALLTGTACERVRVPVAGDVFVAEGKAGLLYLFLYSQEASGSPQTPGQLTRHLEAGCIGPDYVLTELQDFLVTLAVVLKELGVKASWSRVEDRNPRF